jgi:hypothetical protein
MDSSNAISRVLPGSTVTFAMVHIAPPCRGILVDMNIHYRPESEFCMKKALVEQRGGSVGGWGEIEPVSESQRDGL